MTIKYHDDVIQGTPEWLQARCGILTASEMKLIITAVKLEYAKNDKEKGHLYELLAQRITQHVEPHYISDDMLRGKADEGPAKLAYELANKVTVKDTGFVTNDKWGFTIGYSPDGLVGDDGQIETKSRRQKYQLETIILSETPEDYRIQIQTGLLVTERKWCDFISYCGGMHMKTIRVYPDLYVHEAIVKAAKIFHDKMDILMGHYQAELKNPDARLIPTERTVEKDMFV